MLKSMKQNKKGIILVTVLFIFAIAVIFLSCALMMSKNTRVRMYDRAEENQARLTVTSAAEAFYQAIVSQTITDDTLDSIANNTVMTMTAKDASNNYLPGMSPNAGNKTTATIYLANASGTVSFNVFGEARSITDPQCNMLVVFETTIGDGEDMVILKLHRKNKGTTQPAFSQMIETAGSLDGCELNIGAGTTGASSSDNNILVRGDLSFDSATANSSSSYIVLGGYRPSSTMQTTGNLVLWGPDAYFDLDNTSAANAARGNLNGSFNVGGLYFVNTQGSYPTNHPGGLLIDGDNYGWGPNYPSSYSFSNVGRFGFINTSALSIAGTESMMSNMGSKPSTGYVYNTTDGSLTLQNGTEVTFNQVGGNINQNLTNAANNWNGANVDDAFRNDLQSYTSAQLAKVINDGYPTTSADNIGDIFGEGVSLTASGTTLSATALTALAKGTSTLAGTGEGGALTNGHLLPAGTYQIASGTSLNLRGQGSDLYIEVDLSKGDYVIYINGAFELTNVRFWVHGGGSDDFLRIILTDGASLSFGQATNLGDVTQGILSTNSRTKADAETGVRALPTDAGTAKPHCYILGTGSNSVLIGENSVVDAYIGLFDSSYASSTSVVNFYDTPPYFYGRIQAPNVDNLSGANTNIPYCVGPNSAESASDAIIPIDSAYSVIGFEYYY